MSEKILYYDGECALCNRFIIWILPRMGQSTFRLAPLQGFTAQERLGDNYEKLVALDTVVWQYNDDILIKSAAAAQALRHLPKKRWHIVANAIELFPRIIRDGVYDFIARYRKKIFTVCPVVPTKFQGYFLP